jgi:hypothetical protein
LDVCSFFLINILTGRKATPLNLQSNDPNQSNEDLDEIAIYTNEYANKDAFNENDERKLVQLVRNHKSMWNSKLISDRKCG